MTFSTKTYSILRALSKVSHDIVVLFSNAGIFQTFFASAVGEKIIENKNVRKWSMVRNFMIVSFVKDFFDFVHSGCRQGPIFPDKSFGQNGGLSVCF